MGLDGESKMSKSKGNFIGVLEPQEEIWKKLAPAKTDPARIKRSDPGNPELCNIYSYHKLVTLEPELTQMIAQGCRTAGIGCLECKRVLLKNLMQVLGPIQERHARLQEKQPYLREVLERNAAHCRAVAKQTILEAKGKMGLTRTWKIEN